MTAEQIKLYEFAAELGQLPDEKNPLFLFRDVDPQLLARIILHGFDAVAMARRELRLRGLDDEGQKAEIKGQINKAASKRPVAAGKKRKGRGL